MNRHNTHFKILQKTLIFIDHRRQFKQFLEQIPDSRLNAELLLEVLEFIYSFPLQTPNFPIDFVLFRFPWYQFLDNGLYLTHTLPRNPGAEASKLINPTPNLEYLVRRCEELIEIEKQMKEI